MQRLSLKPVGFANTSTGGQPASPLVAVRLREGSVNPPGQWIQLLSNAEAHSYLLIPWGAKLAAIVFTNFCQHNPFYVLTLFIKQCFLAHGNPLFNSNFLSNRIVFSSPLSTPFLSPPNNQHFFFKGLFEH